jgi:hypothetical protein
MQAARQSKKRSGGTGFAGKMPGAVGLQRVLERVWGRWYKQASPVCAMRARPAAACGRGALFVSSPSVPTASWSGGRVRRE